MTSELQTPTTNKVTDWKAHAQECHKKISELLMLNKGIEVEAKDTEFLRMAGVVTVHANSPAAFKEEWAIPRVAEMEIVIHTNDGVFVCKNMEVLKWEDGVSVDVPKDTYQKEGKTVKRPHFAGRRFLDATLASLNAAVSKGFQLKDKFTKRTQADHGALMGLTDRKFVPKDKVTRDNDTPEDKAKKALGA